jgi:hypothetical protein
MSPDSNRNEGLVKGVDSNKQNKPNQHLPALDKAGTPATFDWRL